MNTFNRSRGVIPFFYVVCAAISICFLNGCQDAPKTPAGSVASSDTSPNIATSLGASRTVVGAAVYVPATLLTEPLGEGTAKQLFASLESDGCVVFDELAKSSDSVVHTWTKSTAFYEYLSSDTSLDASLEGPVTLGTTVKVVTKSSNEKNTSLLGAVFEFNAYKQRFDLADDCITGRHGKGSLAADFLADYKALPYPVNKPEMESSWESYDRFLKKYGSHFVSKLFAGARYRSFVTLKSSSAIKERELAVAACLSAEGPTQEGQASVKGCEGVTRQQKQAISLSDYQVNSKAFGGSEELRQLLGAGKAATPELLAEFAKTGETLQDGVKYELMPIWQLLESRFEPGTKEQKIAKSMQAYFEGFLSFNCSQLHGCGCAKVMDKKDKVMLRKFALLDKATALYGCQRPAMGCRNDDDCHYNAGKAYCQCHGDHCVNRGADKLSAVVNYTTKITGKDTGPNKSCHFVKSKLQCQCQRPDSKHMWDTLWRSDKAS
ncbi:hypothetical protein DU002_03015 [Corallincola holothuriorum]|uniref:MACPF domain-containing protein n=1 Tax=Corallincola holothuriorum TaxID=2282215 RepID=A0A368NLI7_9GAMM|nr:MAC/perforin domain-containing protein [Corallincola holothuriorum]RCU51462.1 hypothetical protein DU002_03015 [Corallincola holothuriorum]